MAWKSLSAAQNVNRDASAFLTSVQIARRLLAREAAPGSKGKPEMVGAALQRTLVRVSESLHDSMGEGGRNALLVRALARTEADHPALKNIVGLNEGGIQLDGVVASVDAHGVAAVTAAIEALLAALIDLLARLIGEDMAIRLIDHDAPRSRKGGGAQAS
jgi:hypothetical protein